MGITDIRGIENASKVLLNGTPLKFLAGSTSALIGSGLHAPIPPVDGDQPSHLEFAIELGIQGTSQFDVVPVGRDSQISLNSNWPSPSFNGHYLPVTTHDHARRASHAQWSTSFFSTNLEEALQGCTESGACTEFNSRVLGVSFIDPVDQYLKTDRAIKYAFLFISLTFAGFFLFEVLKATGRTPDPIHAGRRGIGAFLSSVAVAIGAPRVRDRVCVVLGGLCGAHRVLCERHFAQCEARSRIRRRRLPLLYGMLYGLLSADDYALLMGSVLLFGLLAAVMVLTREVDWSSLGRKEEIQ